MIKKFWTETKCLWWCIPMRFIQSSLNFFFIFFPVPHSSVLNTIILTPTNIAPRRTRGTNFILFKSNQVNYVSYCESLKIMTRHTTRVTVLSGSNTNKHRHFINRLITLLLLPFMIWIHNTQLSIIIIIIIVIIISQFRSSNSNQSCFAKIYTIFGKEVE